MASRSLASYEAQIRMTECKQSKSESEDITAVGLKQLTICAEEADENEADLFVAPPRPECPICFLPMPLDVLGVHYMSCCSTLICSGCYYGHQRVIDATNAKNALLKNSRPRLIHSCAFCRDDHEQTLSNKEYISRLEKRMNSNDAVALYRMGWKFMTGESGVRKDERKAFELFLRSADLGYGEACSMVGAYYYRDGRVVEKDKMKYRMYLVKGAKAGYALARYNLGVVEWENGNIELSVKHMLISAGAGHQLSVDALKSAYKMGNISKGLFAKALRSFQAAKDEERSEDRDRSAANPRLPGNRSL